MFSYSCIITNNHDNSNTKVHNINLQIAIKEFRPSNKKKLPFFKVVLKDSDKKTMIKNAIKNIGSCAPFVC